MKASNDFVEDTITAQTGFNIVESMPYPKNREIWAMPCRPRGRICPGCDMPANSFPTRKDFDTHVEANICSEE